MSTEKVNELRVRFLTVLGCYAGSEVKMLFFLFFFLNLVFLSLKIVLSLMQVNSVDPDEMLPTHQGRHCLQKYPFRGFQSTHCYTYMHVFIHVPPMDGSSVDIQLRADRQM